jgi:DivIVA domain-containing protein
VTILLIVVALVVVTGVAVFAVGDSGRLRADEPDREPADLPDDRDLGAADIDRVRFALGVRGYRMDQVDEVLDRFAAELTRRDAYEGALVEQVRELGGEPVAAPAVVPSIAAVPADDAETSPVAVEPVSPDAGEHG